MNAEFIEYNRNWILKVFSDNEKIVLCLLRFHWTVLIMFFILIFRVLIIFVFIWKQKRQIRSICVFDSIVRIGLIVEYRFNIKILFIAK